MRRILGVAITFFLVFVVTSVPVFAAPAATRDPNRAMDGLDIFSDEFPVSFFFRQTEGLAANGKMKYADWNARFSGLMGVMGKMLDEEVIGRSAAQAFYRQFKKDHPRQAVLLHANGCFRKPLADLRAYHAGHWLYFNGAAILSDVAATTQDTTIRVSATNLFELSPYFTNRSIPDDVGLCQLGPDGKPDWNYAEQVRLKAIDPKAGTIAVERGKYGSTPHAFTGGKAYAAAHVAWTWGETNTLWQFNMSTACPRDARGRNAGEVWADELIAAIRPGGAIDYVDGLEFDVPFRAPTVQRKTRQADCDADGKADKGIVGGKPVFAIGYDLFLRRLREALPDHLIMADVGDGKHQRSPDLLNGVETEGWPTLKDVKFIQWSTGLNRQLFWQSRARPPIFTYGLIKFENTTVPPSTVRLTLAGPIFVGAAIGEGYLPPKESTGIWDELVGGAMAKRGWLGRALGPARHLALETPDLLNGAGNPPSPALSALISSEDAKVAVKNGLLTAEGRNAEAPNVSFRIKGLRRPAEGDIVVGLTASAAPLAGYPAGTYREISVAAVAPGMTPPEKPAPPASPLDGAPFTAQFYQRNAPAGLFDLAIVVEGGASVSISKMTVHAASDSIVREFQNGAILANPSSAACDFDLSKLFPGRSFRRLKATAAQDPTTNNGQPVGGVVRLGPLDALFLARM